MGQLRFVVPQPERLEESFLQRAYLGGMDQVPWPTTVQWDDNVLVVERDVRESGTLSIPWLVAGHGELILTTASLMERKQPYLLPLELARGTLHRLRSQVANWQLVGFRPSEPTRALIDEAHESFMRAAMHQHSRDRLSDECDRCLQATLSAIDATYAEFAQAAIRARGGNTPKLATLLAASMESPPLDTRCAKWALATFNTIQLPLCWAEIEQEAGIRSFAAVDNQLCWCREQELKVIAGPLLRPNRRSWPEWLDGRTADLETLQNRVVEYTEDAVRYFQGRVHVWHAVAAIGGDNETRLGEEHRLRLTVSVLETIRRLDPRTPVVVSFDQPWGEFMTRRHYDLSPLHFADMLVRSDLGIAGLGIEINYGFDARATWPHDLLAWNRQIDHWSTLGLPLLLFITAPSAATPDPLATEPTRANSRLSEMGPTPDWQKDFVERVVPFLLSKSAVHSIVWNQLRDDVPHDFPHAGLFDAHGIRKPAMESLADLRKRFLN